MKNLLLLIFLQTYSFWTFGQTLIMNEVSQGVTGNMEYVEFVVVDNTAIYDCVSGQPPTIDIRGWIFDDNSGHHGAGGIAGGCIRFSFDPLWSAVPMGTIILIYNDATPDPSIPSADISLADGNCTIVAPISDVNLFESNSTTPGAVACSYPAAGWTPGGSWSNVLLANTGDCARIVNLAGCEVFSVCYSSCNTNTLIYFQNGAEGGADHRNSVYYFNDGDPNAQINWSIGCTDNEIVLDVNQCGSNEQTPGAPNNALNAAFIAQFNNGCAPIPPLVANALIDNHEICGCDGSATATPSGSIPGYTFEWFDASMTPIGQTSITATGLCAGDYYVEITSSIGCQEIAMVLVNSGTLVPTVTAVNGGNTYCNGDVIANITVDVTGNGPWDVTYTIDGGPTQTASGATSPIVLDNGTGVYVVTGVSDANCSNTASGSQTITVNPLPVISLTPTDPSICNGTNGTILVSGSGTGTIYWSGTSSSNGAGALNYPITNLSTGPYSVYFVDGTTGCQSATANTSLNNPNAPLLNNPGPSTVCDTYTLPAISGTNLTVAASYWTGANGTGAQLSAGNPITTTQTVYIYDINGACSDEESFLVTVNNTPAITNPGVQTVCDSYTLGAIGGTNLTGSQAYYNNSQAMGGTVIAGPISSTQTVWIYDAEGSCSDEESFVVNVDVTPSLTNPGPQTVCDSYSLTAITGTNLSGNENYYNNSQAMGGLVIFGPITSSQTVWIYGNDGSCSDEESFLVTVNITPAFTLTGTDPTVCNGTDGTITISGLNVSTNYDVIYDDDGVGSGTLSLSSNGSGDIVILGLNAGTYDNFTVTLNGCTGSSATLINLINPNAPVLNNPGPQAACDSYMLGAISGVNLSGSEAYYDNSQANGGVQISGQITTSQTIWIYDTQGICSDEESFTITINNTPILNNPGNQTECVSFTLPAITGTTLSGSESFWTSPSGTGTQLSVGEDVTWTQTVYVYDANGACSDEVSFVVTINPLPTVASTSGTNTYCIGDASQNVEVNVTGSTSWTIDYTLDGVAMSATGSSSPVILGNAAGEYILTGITDANCSNSATGTEIITFVGCDYTIPTAFTPNADGVHDDWDLYGLDAAYPNNVVRIYNRWGGLLFEHDSSVDGPYDSNRWKGDYKGKALPVGSYYYIIELNDEDKKVESGAVSILVEK